MSAHERGTFPMPPLPRVTCEGFLSSTGVQIKCASPVMQPGEPGGREIAGQCALCGALHARATEATWVREGRRLLRDRARGYGPGTGDPFAGF